VEWAPRALDELLPPDHVARSLWALVARLDLAAFYAPLKVVAAQPGRPASDPRVLLALWLYATAEGVGSARQLDRLCHEHDAYRWLRGGVPVDYHLLAEFRVTHEQALDQLFTQLLTVLMAEGLLTLTQVAQDGMKVRASAGAASFRTRATLAEHLTVAQAQVERCKAQREQPDPGQRRRAQRAQERAARERLARVEAALAQLPQVEAAKQRQQRTLASPRKAKVKEARASTTDADARVMHLPDGGFRPAVNAQLATDVASQLIVGVAVSPRGSDQGEAWPMAQQVEWRTGQIPGAYLVDGGYVKRADITALEQQGTTVYAPLRPPRTVTSGRTATDPRPDDSPEVRAWRTRMGTDEAKTTYKQRAATAECVNALARLRGLQQFRVRGTDKILCCLLLVALTHNLLRWLSLTA
jgi:transposase